MVLVLDEDLDLLNCYSDILTELGRPHVIADSIEKARQKLAHLKGLRTVLADFYIGDYQNILELLPDLAVHGPVQFIIVTSEPLPHSAPPELLRHLVDKPPDLNHLIRLLKPA